MEEVAHFLNVPLATVQAVEAGEIDMEDRAFFRLCACLGATNDSSIFIEKIEKAFNPQLRKARREMEKTLATYGFRFADSENRDQPDK